MRQARRMRKSDLDLVDPAPSPCVSGHVGPDDRVAGLGEVGSRVPVRRQGATADITAREAEPELDPRAADREALFAALGPWLHATCLIEMRTRWRRRADEGAQGLHEPRPGGGRP